MLLPCDASTSYHGPPLNDLRLKPRPTVAIIPEEVERDLNEAWEQQTATSEILKIINSSPISVQVVLDTALSSTPIPPKKALIPIND